jgi:transposase-like protein
LASDSAELAKDLRPIYSAPTEAAARATFDEAAGKWGERYPAVIRLWQNAWAEFVPFLSYSPEIRKVIYSTDEIVKRRPLVVVVASGRPSRRRSVLRARRARVLGRVAA